MAIGVTDELRDSAWIVALGGRGCGTETVGASEGHEVPAASAGRRVRAGHECQTTIVPASGSADSRLPIPPSRLTWTRPGCCDAASLSGGRFGTNQEEADVERTTIAVDLAKSVFEVAVANDRGQIVERKRYGRTSFRLALSGDPAGEPGRDGGVRHGPLLGARSHRSPADAEALVDASRAERIPAVPVKRAEQQALIAPAPDSRAVDDHANGAHQCSARGLLLEHGLNLPCGAQTAALAVPALLDSSTELPAREAAAVGRPDDDHLLDHRHRPQAGVSWCRPADPAHAGHSLPRASSRCIRSHNRRL